MKPCFSEHITYVIRKTDYLVNLKNWLYYYRKKTLHVYAVSLEVLRFLAVMNALSVC